ncbi:hypothetical protein CHS0354_015476 [Potamilus streckersoni]|uniref:Uncharacterized protein n=1 Tax=Potamilus streckersoni TaxID=2493646 RepID=A0AAE0VTW3_9BIVA|nr:hypothetical protein CHS0354_015476 [Potamilus streckersoni]
MPPPPRGAQFRSRSVPPPTRGYRDSNYRKKKSKREKKKKSKKFRDAPSEVSTDSYAAGYHSDINFHNEGYHFYPPRDFRRRDKQFMNERSFSKSIAKQFRQNKDSKHQSAYELNDAINGPGPLEEFKIIVTIYDIF